MHTTATSLPPLNNHLSHLSFASTRSLEQLEMLRAVVLSLVYFAVTDLGLYSAYDGMMMSLGLALILPNWRPYLLLLVLSVHDAPGQADPSIYVCVAGISLMMVLTAAITRGGSRIETSDDRLFRRIAIGGVLLAMLGIGNSYVQQRLGLHYQIEDRPFWVIGSLIGFMIVSGMMGHRMLVQDCWASPRLRVICVMALGHILLISLLQLPFGPQFGSSPAGLQAMSSRLELIEGGERGVARLTGPFLSPNTLAILPAFYMLIYLRATRSVVISVSFITTFFLVGLTVSMLGAARSMFAFYIAAMTALAWTRSPQRVIVGAICSLPMLLMLDLPFEDILKSMRFQNLDTIQSLGTRGLYWQAVLSNLSLHDWMVGFGLSHWPVFFQFYTGSMASDPHNWIMSMGGSYGLPGLLFYGGIGLLLLKRSLSGPKKLRAISTCLLLLYFGRDLANTQYLVNNHPMCCLYWMALGSAFIEFPDDDASMELK